MQQEYAALACERQQPRPTGEVAQECGMTYTDYMWVDISNWEFGRIHQELQALGDQGWEVDGVIDDPKGSPAAAGGASALSLRLKRQRKY
jgi:hypothetical protein